MNRFTGRIKYCGFTLIELMVTLVVAAILAAIVAPSFKTLIQSTHLSTNANSIVAALSTARSEAIKQAMPVMIKTADGTNNWSGGWQVVKLFNPNGTACKPTNNCLIKVFSALKPNYSISLVDNSNIKQPSLTYLPSGMLQQASSTPMTYRICANGYNNYKSVQIDETGRPATSNISGSCP